MKNQCVENCENCNEKATYVCGVCGKGYNTIEERNKCEAKCLHDRYEAEKKFKEEKLRKEQEIRKKEVDMALDNYLNLRKEYVKDYGKYNVVRTFNDSNNSIWLW